MSIPLNYKELIWMKIMQPQKKRELLDIGLTHLTKIFKLTISMMDYQMDGLFAKLFIMLMIKLLIGIKSKTQIKCRDTTLKILLILDKVLKELKRWVRAWLVLTLINFMIRIEHLYWLLHGKLLSNIT